MDDREEMSIAIAEAAGHATNSIEEMALALSAFARAVGIACRQIVATWDGIAAALAAEAAEEPALRAVATNRQWHLVNHGSWKTRKKWRSALRRKVRIAEKRKGAERAA